MHFAKLKNSARLQRKTRAWIGERFGRLLVTGIYKFGTHTTQKILTCKCDCGKITHVVPSSLHTGATKSCGCLMREFASNLNRTHGMTHTKSYGIWLRMVRRCCNPNNEDYKYYGGRGITVCNKWRHDFMKFYRDMGECPNGKEIDRINNDLGYSKENCHWVTHKENCRNFRQNRVVTIGDESMSMIEWAEKKNINYDTLRARLDSGWNENMLFLPDRQSVYAYRKSLRMAQPAVAA